MKKTIRVFTLAICLAMFLAPANQAMAYDPPGPPSGGHGQNGDQEPTGGSAPVAGGLPFLLLMGAAYGTQKYLKSKKEENV